MAQVREPHVVALGAKEVCQPSSIAVQPGPVVREGAVHEEDRGPPIAVGAEPVQRQLHAVGRGQVAGAHS